MLSRKLYLIKAGVLFILFVNIVLLSTFARNHANGCHPTPPGPEGSNGKRLAVAP